MSVNADDRNEKLLDICVDFSTKDGHGKYQKQRGVGDQHEVYRHFLRLQLRKLNEGEHNEEEKDANLEQGGNIQTYKIIKSIALLHLLKVPQSL